MKKVNIAIIVVMFIVCINEIYASQKVDVDMHTVTSQISENSSVQININLNNLDNEIYVKSVSAYLYFNKTVFEDLTNEDIYINNRVSKDYYDQSSKKLYYNNSFKLNNSTNLLTINLKVKENVKIDSGYFELKQLCLVDENNNKIDFSDKSLSFKISNSNNNNKLNNIDSISSINSINNIENIGNIITSSLPQIKNLDKFENIFNIPIISNIPKIFTIPLEGMWIIVYSFIIVIGFRVIVSVIYKTLLRVSRKYRQISQIKRMDKIFKNINTKIVD